MYQINIRDNEAGQRFDKYLQKFMPTAPSSFIYKMLRKKNITLNGKKTEGKEKLVCGDEVCFFLSEETYYKFTNNRFAGEKESTAEVKLQSYAQAYEEWKNIEIIYENKHVILMNKPAGILSQKSEPEDLSLNEWMIGYLVESGQISAEALITFKPSVCNRLDRNTSGLVIGSKTLAGSQKMNELIANRKIHKYYRLFVKGKAQHEETLEGILIKNHKTNQVEIKKEPAEYAGSSKESGKKQYIKTRYYPISIYSDMTLLEAELITGKTHQIRAHMASVGHPLLGDYKYGDKQCNDYYKRKYGIASQLLHAYRLEFPEMDPPFKEMSGMTAIAKLPEAFGNLLASESNKDK